MNNLKMKMIEENFFRPKWYSIFLNPYFINRNGIYKAIKDFAVRVPENAELLDIGCGIKPYEGIFMVKKYTGIDIKGGGHADEEKKVDAFFDGIHIPFEDRSFGIIICTEVLEHAENPEELIKECFRVLKPHGEIFISMPFVYPEHEKPYDFRRFTRFEHQRVLQRNGFSEISIVKTSGYWGTFGQLLVIMAFEGISFRATYLKTFLSVLLFGPIQAVFLFLDLIFVKTGPTLDYIVKAKKIT